MHQSPSKKETLLLKQPTLSGEDIAFLYAGDLWIARRDGSLPRRLTAQMGQKTGPAFSPDGAWIAFSANYDGNLSVYVIPREGGSPRRLTYHPQEDWVRGWTQDGKGVLFASSRASYTGRIRRLFSISLEGGLPSALLMPTADRGCYAPDGNHLAYTPYPEAFWSWKRYRGGRTVPIWVLDLTSHDHVQIPHENASDTFPCWIGDSVYFISDRRGVMNLFRWDASAGTVEQLTSHSDYDIRSLTAGDGELAYEQAGRIHLYDPATRLVKTLSISIVADLPYTRPYSERGVSYIQNYAISPTGQRAVFEARGDIFTVPAKKGDARNLTHTPGAAERFPAWSPDGQSIAYFSDASGEYNLIISDQRGVKTTTIPLNKKTFFYSPLWSPDSRWIAFTDKALHLYTINVETKIVTLVDSDTYDHPERSLSPSWSPDSRWLAYTRRLDNQIRTVFLYNLTEGMAVQVTDGMSDTTDACFSRDGKYLFFTASSNYGLNTGWLDMSSIERPVSRSLYAAVLSKDDPSPSAPESDDEKPPEEKYGEKEKSTGAKADNPQTAETGAEAKPVITHPASSTPNASLTAKLDDKPAGEQKPGDEEKKKTQPKVKVDLEGLAQRIISLPMPARNYQRLQTAEDRLFFLEPALNQGAFRNHSGYTLWCYNLKDRKAEVFLDRIQSYWVSADGKKLLYRAASEPKFAITGFDKKADPAEGILDMGSLEVTIDPKAEWQQIFREAFRIHRDFFYDPGMHGLDLEAAYQKYLPFLEHVGHRDDLNYLLAEFSGELRVGHAYVGGGDIPSPAQVPVGLLGVDYEIDPDGFYRFKKIFPGLNWHPEIRSPLTEPGDHIKEGEFILAVNGRSVRAPTSIYSLFERTAGRITDLLVGPSSDPTTARTVSVKPLFSEDDLRHWSWVEDNRQKVAELSGGRIAYVYMPDTGLDGYANFNRYYFSQLNKEAVVLDERFNGGGYVADYVIDLLNRPILSYWATREGKEFATPNASIFGPKVMIINEQAGSGGDAMPLFFRRRGLGKLVGKRTWGGLIGIYDYPVLIDGGFFSSPRLAIFSPQGEWEVENEGVAPDVEVEMTPRLVIAGHDPQLEKAVELIMAELETSPPVRPARPAPVLRAAHEEK
jgi:tricorn protease